MQTLKGTFTDGLTIEGTTHRDFEMRIPLTGDLLDAEDELSADSAYKPQTFAAALASIVLVRVGSYTGPFSTGLLRGLSRRDFYALRDALNSPDAEGKSESSGTDSS